MESFKVLLTPKDLERLGDEAGGPARDTETGQFLAGGKGVHEWFVKTAIAKAMDCIPQEFGVKELCLTLELEASIGGVGMKGTIQTTLVPH